MLACWGRSRRQCPDGVSPGLAQGATCSAADGDRGMATAEFAVVLPAVVLVLAMSLGAMGLAWDQVRCVDAARAGARAAARGDSSESVTQVAARAAPSRALVSLALSGNLVRVSVVSRPPIAGGLFPAWLRASSTASAAREPWDPHQIPAE